MSSPVSVSSTTILTCGVLLLVDSAGLKDANFSDKLSRLSWGNIPQDATIRYAAHVTVVWVSTYTFTSTRFNATQLFLLI
ncbi:hypothetical protein BC835DRAFT_1414345 [Cytidiella melzeri]|nr:hypothetical protein BC835DRAFT_1414345 [Cytidiella melzeri]